MKNIPSLVKSLSLMLIVTFVSIPVISWAADTDPDGVKLMLLHEDPKFKADLKEKIGGAGNTDWALVCDLEINTGVGAIIWESRRKQDKCSAYTEFDTYGYCEAYSDICPHYSWYANCVLDKLGKESCAPW